ncbi:hypothetical protein FBF30_01430 [Candidatus Saccharibacteria bacterium oral taxon 955]|nr:hypothetical protein FBF30_01430 [Candidatus Saccharibacteria bacterium oral taxon 955]
MEKKDLEVIPGFKEGRFARWLRRVVYPFAARTPLRVFLSLSIASALMWWGLCTASAGTSAGDFPVIMAGAVMMLGSAIGIFLPIAAVAAVYRRQDAELAALVVSAVCSQIPVLDPSSTDEVDKG